VPPPYLDPAFWGGKRVLLTGDTGFKGAWTALWLHRLGAQVTGLSLAPEPLSLFRLLRLHELVNSHFADIRDPGAVADAVADCRPQLVLHMAAQPLVSRGLTEPAETFATNVQGTVHVLDALRAAPDLRAALVVTTDKVYRNDDSGRLFQENDRLGGSDPYAASKAACEIATASLSASYMASRGIPVATARGGNVIGGGDFAPGRLVPDIVRAAQSGQPPVLRDPAAIRPWQHVLDCVCGYLAYLAGLGSGRSLPQALNFGPRQRRPVTVGELASAMLQAIGAGPLWTHTPKPDAQEKRSLHLDSRLARRTLGWSDRLSGTRMVATTAAWYRAWAQQQDMQAVTLAQIAEYEAMP
jgi:CDP-glucose 4,6-dehydratase